MGRSKGGLEVNSQSKKKNEIVGNHVRGGVLPKEEKGERGQKPLKAEIQTVQGTIHPDGKNYLIGCTKKGEGEALCPET